MTRMVPEELFSRRDFKPYSQTRPKLIAMRFIQVFNRYLKPGGEENSVKRIAAHLELGGHRVSRFWRSSDEWLGPDAPSRFRQPLLLWKNAAVLRDLQDFHEREKPAAWILHNVLPVVSLGVYRLARELNVPVVQWLHNYRPLSPSGTLQAATRLLRPDDPWIAWKETWAGTWRGRFPTAMVSLGYARIRWRGDFSNVRAWVSVSAEMRNIFARAGWPEDRLFTLRHSWDIQGNLRAERDEGYFFFLGRMVEEKGVRFLVNLWKSPALAGSQLVLAGDGPLRHELCRTTSPNVKWVGYVEGEQKRQLIEGCRAVVFPSIWPEPLSTVAYEAYENAKPVITSDAGGMKEIVLQNETGRVVKAAASVLWQEAILQLAGDAALARAWGLNGRRWLENNVSPDVWNRRFNQIIEQTIEARKSN